MMGNELQFILIDTITNSMRHYFYLFLLLNVSTLMVTADNNNTKIKQINGDLLNRIWIVLWFNNPAGKVHQKDHEFLKNKLDQQKN